jgi:hypothetical protein
LLSICGILYLNFNNLLKFSIVFHILDNDT